MRASRLLSLLFLLQLRVKLTARELAEELEVTERTIYRDVEELSAAGVPIRSDRGPGGGFQLVDGYRTRLTGLASEEAEAVFMIGLPDAASALGLGSAATMAGRKLLAALPPALSESAGRIGARFHLDPVDWYRAAPPAEHLPAIARAVLDQRPIAMRYSSWTGVRDWRVEPLGMVQKAGSWYLVARGGGKERIFRVSNVLELQTGDARFERPANFDLAAYWAAELERFEANLRKESAVLRVSALGRERLAKLGAYAALALERTSPPSPGPGAWAPVELPIENVEQAALALLGIGPEVEILGPAALRARVGELARQIAALAD
jgi:predicted DNA-binding transcriptional regulator YafY